MSTPRARTVLAASTARNTWRASTHEIPVAWIDLVVLYICSLPQLGTRRDEGRVSRTRTAQPEALQYGTPARDRLLDAKAPVPPEVSGEPGPGLDHLVLPLDATPGGVT